MCEGVRERDRDIGIARARDMRERERDREGGVIVILRNMKGMQWDPQRRTQSTWCLYLNKVMLKSCFTLDIDV